MFQTRQIKRKATRLRNQGFLFPTALILILSLAALPPLFNNYKAYAHGPGPGSCGNEYEYTLDSFTLSNGVHTFDMLSEQDNAFLFNADNSEGYDVTFTVHTASQSRGGNTQNGSMWYNHHAYGFGLGVCVYDVWPDQDVTVTLENIVSAQASDNTNVDQDNSNLGPIPWYFNYFETEVQYLVNWYTKEGFPAETGISSVTIESRSVNASYSNINGFYVNVTHNGQLVDSGFTPVTFTLENNKEYEIAAADHGRYHFYFWQQAWDKGAILPLKIAETTEAVFYANYVERDEEEQPTDTPSTTSELTVNTKDGTSGNAINGYWAVLSKDGNTVATGFSPATFTLDNNEDYAVSVADYGEYVFDHWEDKGSTARDRSISISSDTSITAVYRNVDSPPLKQPPDEEPPSEDEEPPSTPPPAEEESSVTIRSIDGQTDSSIEGYYTMLFDQGGSVIDTGFTPVTFDLMSGQTYAVEVQDYGAYAFQYWQEDGDMDRNKVFTATDSSTTFTAVYSTSPLQPPSSDDDNTKDNNNEEPPASSTEIITVTTVDSSGNEIFGYYTTLWLNGQQVQSAYSPAEFTVDSGQTYQVAVSDYGSYVFDHWSEGSTSRLHDAVAGNSLTAVYRN